MALSLGDIEKKDPQLGSQVRLSIGSLTKAAEQAGGINMDGLEAQVLAVLDFSGSMADEYNLDQPRPRRGLFGSGSAPDPVDSSQVAQAISRVLAVGATLDPDQSAQALFFDSGVTRAKNDINLGAYTGWLSQNIPSRMGSTRMDLAVLETIRWAAEILGEPAIAQNAHTRGGWRPVMARMPLLVPFITDGEPDRGYEEETRQAFRAASYCPIEFVVMYVSNQPGGLRFVRELNDLGGTFVDNINVVEFLGGMQSVSDEKFADATLLELPGWVKDVRGQLLPAHFAA